MESLKKTSWTQGSTIKLLNTRLTCAFVIAGLLFCLTISRAKELVQEETVTLPPPLNLPLVTAEDAINGGTFWSLQISNSAPLPFNPFPNLTVYDLGSGQFLFDDRTVDYVALEQQRQLEKALLRATALSLDLAVEEDESGGGAMMMSALCTTNDLWLEITGVTNTDANLLIHTPWNDTNLTYDLFYITTVVSGLETQ